MDWVTKITISRFLLLVLIKVVYATIVEHPYPDSGNTILVCPEGESHEKNGWPVLMCPTAECDSTVPCVPNKQRRALCSATDQLLPNAKADIVNKEDIFYAVHYTCESDFVWLTGHTGAHMTACVDGFWSPINDICVKPEDLILPTICSEMLFDYDALVKQDFLHIYPSSLIDSGPVEVYCELDRPNLGDNGWTTVYYNNLLLMDTPDEELKTHNDTPIVSEDLLEESPYFIGIKNFYGLSREKDDAARPLVVQIIMVADTGIHTAIYDEVSIEVEGEGDATSFKLTSVGNYHGDAGDAFRNNLDQVFALEDDWRGWFCSLTQPDYTGCFISNEKLVYGTLPNPTISQMHIRVRPKDFDSAHACPAVLPGHIGSTWSNTDLAFYNLQEIAISRAPGSFFSFSCFGRHYFENKHGERMSSAGAVGCIDNGVDQPPTWNASVVLPCLLVCPEGYTEQAGPPIECYNVSETGHPQGYFGAAQRCLEDEGMLADNPDYAFLSENELVESDHIYYTAHAKRGNAAAIIPGVVNCTGKCETTPTEECLALGAEGKYTPKSCHLPDMRYICKIPGVCPFNGTYLRGKCLDVFLIPGESIIVGLEYCQSQGGGLLVPETLEILDLLKSTVPEDDSVDLYLGSNDVFGDWTINGLYNPDQSVIELMGNTENQEHWRIASLTPSDYSVRSVDVEELQRPGDHLIFCSYPGPVGCLGDPPEPTDYMELEPLHEELDTINNMVKYKCDHEGIFMDANLEEVEIEFPCLSQLGGWHWQEIPECTPTPCDEDPPEPKTNTTYDHSNGDEYVASEMVTYTCDPNYILNYTTMDKAQNLSCGGVHSGWNEESILPCLPSMCKDVPISLENANSSYVVNATYYLGDQLQYTCDLGYFVAGNLSQPHQNISCQGYLYGWVNHTLSPCLPKEACLEELVEGNFTLVWHNNSRFYGEQVKAHCFSGMETEDGLSVQNYTCSYNETSALYAFEPQKPQECKVCTELVIANATSNWDTKPQWFIGDSALGECDEVFEVEFRVKTFNVSCEVSGWNVTSVCQPACVQDLPEIMFMNLTSPLHNRVGTVLTFKCDEGLYIPTEKYLPEIPTSLNLTCAPNTTWVSSEQPLYCISLCTEAPRVVNATTPAWDVMNLWKTKVVMVANCMNNHEFEYGKTSTTFKCTESGWENVTGCYPACTAQPPEGVSMIMQEPEQDTEGTVIEYTCKDDLKLRLYEEYPEITNKASVVCSANLTWELVDRPLYCEEPNEDPPEMEVEGAVLKDSEGPYRIGQKLTYYCKENMLSVNGTDSTFATLTEDGWVLHNSDFVCYKVSYVPPTSVPSHTDFVGFDAPYYPYKTLKVKCREGMISNTSRLFTTYVFTPDGWNQTEPHFTCFRERPYEPAPH